MSETEENSIGEDQEQLHNEEPEEIEEDGDDTVTSECYLMDMDLDAVDREEEVIEEHIVSKSDDEENYIHEDVSDEEDTEQDSVLANGLDPMATHLISSTSMTVSTPIIQRQETPPSVTVQNEFIVSKINREVRNLQTSTNDAEDLYSKLALESPRRVKKVFDNLKPDDVMDDDEKSSDARQSPSIESLAVTSTSDSMATRDTQFKSNGTIRNRVGGYTRVPVRKRKRNVAKEQAHDESTTNSEKGDFNELDDPDDDENETEQKSDNLTQASFESNSTMAPPKIGWDQFCFKCHSNSGIISLPCSKCRCSYHRICVRNNPIPKNVEEFVCPECRELDLAESSPLNKYGHERIEPRKLSEMLGVILSKLQENNQQTIADFKSESSLRTGDASMPIIVNNMSFSIMESRIKENFYTTSEAFVHDIKMLEHNWTIIDRDKAKIFKQIIKNVVTEVNELESCVYCYEDSFQHQDWFVRVCKRPHLLVWAKLKGYPYWPAKIMSINQQLAADVRFFGAHDRAWVPTASCMLFCDKDPNKVKESIVTKPSSQKGFSDAINEKDLYIENLRKLYGFESAPPKTILDPNNLTAQLEMLLPAYREVKEEKETQKEKLLMKIVKRQSSKTYQVETKDPEVRRLSTSINSRDNKMHYKVVANNDVIDDVQPTKKLNLILKRSKDKDLDSFTSSPSSKRQKVTADDISETSESSNMSITKKVDGKQRGKPGRKKSSLARADSLRKSVDVKVPAGTNEIIHLKDDSESSAKLVSKAATIASARGRKRAQSTFHRRQSFESDAKRAHHLRRSSVSIYDKKMNKGIEVVRASSPCVTRAADAGRVKTPTASDVRETRSEKRKTRLIVTPPNEPGKRRKRRFQNVQNAPVEVITPQAAVEVEPEENVEKEPEVVTRRVVEEEPIVSIEVIVKPPKSKTPSPTVEKEAPVFKEPTPEIITNGPSCKENTNGFDPKLMIKPEPVSDNEDNVSTVDSENSSAARSSAFVSTRDKPVRKTLTVSNVFEENYRAKAKKSFLNSINARQAEMFKNQQWMTSIPNEVVSCNSSRAPSPTNSISISNRSSPEATSQTVLTPQSSNTPQPPLVTICNPVANVPPYTSSACASQNSSPQVSPNKNCVPPHQPPLAVTNPTMPQVALPRLIPRAQGVFVSEGSAFSRDAGPVGRMLTDNSHRIADFFKNVLLDTVGSFAPEHPITENLILRNENERLQREMQNVKADCQQKMHELRREHQEDLDDMRKKYDDLIENIKRNHQNEMTKAIQDIKAQCESEKARAIDSTKRELKNTTWCAMCKKEARFYCCWNTSYCGQGCQRSHWQIHQKQCSNRNSAQDVQQPIQQHQIQQQQLKQIQLQQQNQHEFIQMPQQVPNTSINNTMSRQQTQPQLVVRSPQQIHVIHQLPIQPQQIPRTFVLQQQRQQQHIAPKLVRQLMNSEKIILHPVNNEGEMQQFSTNADVIRTPTNALSTVTSTTTSQE